MVSVLKKELLASAVSDPFATISSNSIDCLAAITSETRALQNPKPRDCRSKVPEEGYNQVRGWTAVQPGIEQIEKAVELADGSLAKHSAVVAALSLH